MPRVVKDGKDGGLDVLKCLSCDGKGVDHFSIRHHLSHGGKFVNDTLHTVSPILRASFGMEFKYNKLK